MNDKLILLATACATILTGSMTAQATVVTSIQINNSVNSWLQVAELQAFSNGTNVALASNGASATATSTYDPGGPNSLPGNAIDGNTQGDYYAAPYIFHSGSPASSESLTVTFAHAFDITGLTIYGRTDCCSDRDSYTYTLFDGATAVGAGSLDARTTHVASVSLPAVPEPAAWTMMLAGFAMVGFAMRRRATVSARYA